MGKHRDDNGDPYNPASRAFVGQDAAEAEDGPDTDVYDEAEDGPRVCGVDGCGREADGYVLSPVDPPKHYCERCGWDRSGFTRYHMGTTDAF